MTALNAIGEDVVRRCPPHGDDTDLLGVSFANAIVTSHSFYDRQLSYAAPAPAPAPAPDLPPHVPKQTKLGPFFVYRFADSIKNATNQRQHSPLRRMSAPARALTDRAVDLVRLLYLRDLVGVELTLGWADFLLYMDRVPSPFDPLVLQHDINYSEKSIEDQGFRLLDTGTSTAETVLFEGFAKDEEGDYLLEGELLTEYELRVGWAAIPGAGAHRDDWDLNYVIAPMYDYALLLLNAELAKPWTRFSHWSFSESFRDAVLALFLVGYRCYMPPEVTQQIVEFLPRSFFVASDAVCSQLQCQFEHYVNRLQGSRTDGDKGDRGGAFKGKGDGVVPCACGLKWFCAGKGKGKSKCASRAMYEGHKKECGVGACRFPLGGVERELLGTLEGGAEGGGGGGEGEDGEEEWESVSGSEDGEEQGDGDGAEDEDWGVEEEQELEGTKTPKDRAREKAARVTKHFKHIYEDEIGRFPWQDGADDDDDDDGGGGDEDDDDDDADED
jgi:hypothetical protein